MFWAAVRWCRCIAVLLPCSRVSQQADQVRRRRANRPFSVPVPLTNRRGIRGPFSGSLLDLHAPRVDGGGRSLEQVGVGAGWRGGMDAPGAPCRMGGALAPAVIMPRNMVPGGTWTDVSAGRTKDAERNGHDGRHLSTDCSWTGQTEQTRGRER